jgi:hypothetical protein
MDSGEVEDWVSKEEETGQMHRLSPMGWKQILVVWAQARKARGRTKIRREIFCITVSARHGR